MADFRALNDEADPELKTIGIDAMNKDNINLFSGTHGLEDNYEEEEYIPPSWKVGQEVEVYSRSKDKWTRAVIRKIMRENGDDWVQVYYKNSTQMKDVRADSEDIREIEEDIDVQPAAPPSRPKSSQRKRGGVAGQGFTDILHKVSAISRQVESGLYLVKRVAAVIRRMAQLEETHVGSTIKALEQERTKIKDKMMDEMTRVVDAWNGTDLYLTSMLDKRLELAKKMEQQIAVPMMQFYNDAELKRKAIIKDEKKYGVEMNRAKLGVQKNLINCQKLLKSCILAKAEAEEKKIGKKQVKKKKFGGVLNWARGMMRGNLTELQNQAATAAKNYIACIEYANDRQRQYYGKELPLVCKQFEMLERSRMNAMQKYLNTLNSISFEHADPLVKLISEHKARIRDIDPDADIADFTATTIRMYGPVHIPEPFTYDLACQVKDINAGRFEGNPNSFFYATIEHCMEMTSAKYPSLPVPVIVVNLIKSIEGLGGYSVEGIFRLSAKKEDLDCLRKQFDQGNYEVKESSPHVAAGLLKQWLRELAEPLIPTELYMLAIDLAKSKPQLAQVKEFAKKLPALNWKVLETISVMAGKIAALSAVNKMTYSNLAIVFAPGMLRNPSEDPAEMLENSKYETLITKFLLQISSNEAPPA
mmetsp:Transcript_28559/g.69630  ORF Transcript_28559/g.69630 Transcript_28559/m.69630 type:complete len:645 (-) Transcript_28559:269-2203(-)